MAFTFYYPVESAFDRRNAYYQSPWWGSVSHNSPLALASDLWSSPYDDFFDSVHRPYQYRIVRRKLTPVKRQQSDPEQYAEDAEESAADDEKSGHKEGSSPSKETSNKGEKNAKKSQPATSQDDQQTKKARFEERLPSSKKNAGKKSRNKKSTIASNYRGLGPWLPTLVSRPWHNIADVLEDMTPDNIFGWHHQNGESDNESSSSDSNAQDVVTSRSHIESRTQKNGQDNYTYYKSSFKKQNGESKTVITQSIGDQKHTLATIVDAEGNERRSEDYVNVEEDKIEEFKESLKRLQSGGLSDAAPKKLCNEPANSDEAESRNESVQQ
ncbi:uncharacterized protein TRIADDRAFT_52760 [Trichoplax adhaerens]|uniref:Uncharacterized protein n=1 Tax=Trichoplax adhaerens TaxID=10228 RepID=B3RK93_TRIAD|nr:hypothetical protein TRIADDRAFT_52760 [Trichoplax adhaerens]EDV29160.1 hypothetical protein TRIADDRAFT_52760 [Trichoplax adhaerens]|eukprot:XP_002108362.1 hypothetical protein TRIADDRAFT_52760 [Trichoplax adhaerens]